jgi:8-hydroxy-5-deazaflavin:NADPH oxidoreductase
MKIGVVGSGVVATTLAAGFLRHGYDVTIGSRSPEKLKDFAAQNKGVKLGTFAEAAAFGEVIVVAVKGNAAAEALRLAGAANLVGKPVIDATNPIKDAPPAKGVLQFFTDINFSLMEQLQAEFPEAHLVKAFNSVGAPAMVDPAFVGGKPTMFIAGNSEAAKAKVQGILENFGGYGCSRGRSRHRAPVHAVVHPGVYEE